MTINPITTFQIVYFIPISLPPYLHGKQPPPVDKAVIYTMEVNNHRRKYWLITKVDNTTSLVYNLVKWCEANDYDVQKLYHLNRLKIRTYKDITQVQSLNQHEYAAFATGNQFRDRCSFIDNPRALDSLAQGE